MIAIVRTSTLAFGLALLPAAALGQDAPPAPAPAPAPTPAPAAAPPADNPSLQAAKDAFKKGSWAEADDAAVKALGVDSKNLEALYIAGAAERQINKLDDAETHLKALVDASPNFPQSNFQLGYVYFLQAEQMARDGKFEPAKARYTDAADQFAKETARNDKHVPSLSSRAIALTRAGKLDDAVPAYEGWIAAVPQKNDPVVALASAYAAAGKSTEAMATLDRLPDKTPKAAFDAVMAAANVFVAKRDWGAAVPFLEKAAATDESSTRAVALLAEACARSGLTAEAVTHLQKLLTMEPTPEEAESVGEAIKASVGDGKSSPSVQGVEPPATLRVPSPRYPKGQDTSVQTDVLILAEISGTGAVMGTVLVPNRIWKDIRSSGFEAEAQDAVKRGKFAPGTKNGQPAELWTVVAVKFARQ
ncbi:MAG TPA: tetratricopeptide repeat protein [Candidatus Polarisedimenticolaceae bacterium]|nr:tetratricopeptide repeat protein [Candidatus Polarisedimenticolaceae bacterium]